MQKDTVVRLYDRMEADGYEPGEPSELRLNAIAHGVNHEACEESSCMKCGHQGLSYHPFRLRQG